jgi:hypothetical protein
LRSVYNGINPAAFCSISTNPSLRFVDDDLDRQVLLHDREQLAKQRREPAVTSQANYLPAGLAFLQAERRGHAARHRAVQQAGEGSTLAPGVDVAKHPDRRDAIVIDDAIVVVEK